MSTILAVAVAAVIIVTLTAAPTYAQTTIPDWVKDVAGFWADGLIDDEAYAGTIEYLVNEGVIAIQAEPAPVETTSVCESFWDDQIEQFAVVGLRVIGQDDPGAEEVEYLASIYRMIDERRDRYLETTPAEERNACFENHSDGYVFPFAPLEKPWFDDYEVDATITDSLELYYEVMGIVPEPSSGNEPVEAPVAQADGASHKPSLFDYDLVDIDVSLFNATVKECGSGVGGLVRIPVVIENMGSQEANVQYQVHIMTENGTVINSSQMLEQRDLGPGMSAHTSGNVPDVNEVWSECGVTIESATAWVAKTVSDPSPPSTSTENSTLDIEIIACTQSSSQYVEVEGKIKNLSAQTYDVKYIYYVADSNKDIITFEKATAWDLGPGQTEFVDRLIRYSGSWEYCGIQTTR